MDTTIPVMDVAAAARKIRKSGKPGGAETPIIADPNTLKGDKLPVTKLTHFIFM